MRYCRKCGNRTGMVVEETATGKVIEEIDLCYDCLWAGTVCSPIVEQITLQDADEVADWKEVMKRTEKELLNDLRS